MTAALAATFGQAAATPTAARELQEACATTVMQCAPLLDAAKRWSGLGTDDGVSAWLRDPARPQGAPLLYALPHVLGLRTLHVTRSDGATTPRLRAPPTASMRR